MGRWLGSLALGLVCLAVPGCKPSAEGLVQKALEARGGVERLRALHSQRLTGRISLGAQAGTLRVEFKRPDKMRIELGLPGGTLLRLFDGTEGWVSDTSLGHAQLRPMSQEEVGQARREADMDGPLVDSAQKGIRISVAGQGRLEGRPTEGLDVVFKDGTLERYQLDPRTHEPLGWVLTATVDGKEVELQSTVRATRRVEGLLFPTSIEQSATPGHPAQQILIERVELNPLLDDARFRPPTLGGAPLP